MRVACALLEQILALAFLEDIGLELDEIVGDEQRDQDVGVRVDRHIQSNRLRAQRTQVRKARRRQRRVTARAGGLETRLG